MRTLDLGKYRKARVWIGTLPDAAYSPREVITRVFSAGAGMRTETRAVAIEILVPLGPRSMYGLLGCHFNPDRMGQLGVDVHVASSNGPVLPDSLATRGDEVRIGLPAEYAGAILAGVSLEKDQDRATWIWQAIVRLCRSRGRWVM
jgi:hypothetical protein